jgi:uncharacterized protein with HEPN domain
MKDESLYLRHILVAIDRIEAYSCGGRKEFFRNTMIQDAVIRNLEIIGEATRHLTLEITGRYPGVPWRKITALRNVLIHEYFGVDLEIVWRVVQKRLPQLKLSIETILSRQAH